ncbi:MAG: type I-C CRISPR-associated protein Cas5c [Vicinamibacteria bacterium]
MTSNAHTLEVWGDFACFTRPEMKVERFSYPVITPSAARGIFDAIYWDGKREKQGNREVMRPYFHWQIERIELLEIPRFIALRRNEVKGVVPGAATLNRWMRQTAPPGPLWADGDDETTGRTQRQTMALKRVRYRITARIEAHPSHRAELGKLNACFVRRAKAGKCFQQPYFGCREFPAFFEYIEPNTALPPPADFDQHVGWMVYDVFDLSKDVTSLDGSPSISVFDAWIRAGVVSVPAFGSDEVRKIKAA